MPPCPGDLFLREADELAEEMHQRADQLRLRFVARTCSRTPWKPRHLKPGHEGGEETTCCLLTFYPTSATHARLALEMTCQAYDFHEATA